MSEQNIPRTSVVASAGRQCLSSSDDRRRRMVAASGAAGGLQVSSVGTVAFAQAQAQPALEEIVVTATRREQTVNEIPFNISAVSGETLAESNFIDAVDALRTMSGISVQDRGYRNSGMGSSTSIRGINIDSGSWGDVPLAAAPTVATYDDNTALPGCFILKDIERVEVLRGPQGTLYGSGSRAGNVRFIMNKPDISAFSVEASRGMGVTEGSDGYNLNPDIMLNIPAGDALAFRLNAGMIDNDGIVDYPHVYAMRAAGLAGDDKVKNSEPATSVVSPSV